MLYSVWLSLGRERSLECDWGAVVLVRTIRVPLDRPDVGIVCGSCPELRLESGTIRERDLTSVKHETNGSSVGGESAVGGNEADALKFGAAIDEIKGAEASAVESCTVPCSGGWTDCDKERAVVARVVVTEVQKTISVAVY